MADDRDEVERERTTVVETGGGGGGGVLAVVLLIIVVLVLLFLFRGQLGLGGKTTTSTFPTRSTSTSTTLTAISSAGGLRVPARARARLQQGPRPFDFAAPDAVTGAHDDALRYMTGFGGHFESEAVAGCAAARAATRRSGRPSASMPSSCREAPSPRRGTRTAGPGCTGCGRPPITGRSRATRRAFVRPGHRR